MGLLDPPAVSRAALAADVGNPASLIGAAMAVDFTPIFPPATLTAPYEAIYSNIPIVVIRVDDNRTIDATIATELTSRNLVGTFCCNIDNVGDPGYVSAATLLAWQRAGHEITHHGRAHTEPPANVSIYSDEVVTAANELRALGLHVQSFTQPGSWSGAYHMDDYAKLDTFGGKILRKNFAASQGYLKDGPATGIREFPAPTPYGASHFTWETGGVAAAQVVVEQAIAYGGNVEFLTHCVNLGQPGYNTLANYTDFLTWLAAQRDAGRVRVMTSTAAMRAKPGTPKNLLIDPSFETFATAPGNTLWTRSGTNHAPEAGRLSGYSARATAGTATTLSHEFAGGSTLRSVEMTGWCRGLSAASTARMLAAPYNASNATGTSYSKTQAVTTDWTFMRFNLGAQPDCARMRFQFGANTGAPDVLWDDVAVYRV